MNQCLTIGSVISFDQEVSPIYLYHEKLDIQYKTRWNIFGCVELPLALFSNETYPVVKRGRKKFINVMSLAFP